MKISNETKAKILAPYVGSARIVNNYAGWLLNYGDLCSIVLSNLYSKAYIEVIPLSKITDEDALSIATAFGCVVAEVSKRTKDCILMIDDSYEIQISYDGYICVRKNKELYNQKVLIAYQMLQLKGYALPYMKYSVEDLVEAGVYKLKN